MKLINVNTAGWQWAAFDKPVEAMTEMEMRDLLGCILHRADPMDWGENGSSVARVMHEQLALAETVFREQGGTI